MDGRGVRCVSDRPWITAAETCECELAHLAVGEDDTARTLFGWAQTAPRARRPLLDRASCYPDEVHFPGGEQSTYTAAGDRPGRRRARRDQPRLRRCSSTTTRLPALIDTHTESDVPSDASEPTLRPRRDDRS